jgi:hypothetical protein
MVGVEFTADMPKLFEVWGIVALGVLHAKGGESALAAAAGDGVLRLDRRRKFEKRLRHRVGPVDDGAVDAMIRHGEETDIAERIADRFDDRSPRCVVAIRPRRHADNGQCL